MVVGYVPCMERNGNDRGVQILGYFSVVPLLGYCHWLALFWLGIITIQGGSYDGTS